MDISLKNLPVEERLRLVEELWDSIAQDQAALPLSPEQAVELDRRLYTFELDHDLGRPAKDVLTDIRKRL
ncbi:addiction module protein [Spongiibacter sp. KMU-158]|uniref:Addiction module protein n=2 Tax=Spongiibacter pelagi TaxID=2760804 RepID=A0A927C3S6_9GAMM|nr:addiction module protein [Spongiibacter pelagi]